jgi:trk system potassium uptake protein TrkH
MNWTVVQRILGLLLMMFSFTMLPPIVVSLLFDDQNWLPFVEGFGLTLAAGFLCWLPVNRSKKDLRLRDGFLVVASFWTVLGTFGAAPLYFADPLSLSFTDAVFESMSGLTTTGATVLTGLDSLPASILYYRQQLQWLGGMGIIVLAVAVLPMLGVGGMQLYRAETPGPVKDTKLTPRITETAKALSTWFLRLPAHSGTSWPEWACLTRSAMPFQRWLSAASRRTTRALPISTVPGSIWSPCFSCLLPASTFPCTSSPGVTFRSNTISRTRNSGPTASS